MFPYFRPHRLYVGFTAHRRSYPRYRVLDAILLHFSTLSPCVFCKFWVQFAIPLLLCLYLFKLLRVFLPGMLLSVPLGGTTSNA